MGWDDFWFQTKFAFSSSFQQEVADSNFYAFKHGVYSMIGSPDTLQDAQLAKCFSRAEQWINQNPRIGITNTAQVTELSNVGKDIQEETTAYFTQRGGYARRADSTLRICYNLEGNDFDGLAANGDETMTEIGRRLVDGARKRQPTRTGPERLQYSAECGSLQETVKVINWRFDQIIQFETQGLLDHDKLFPRGGSHDQRRQEMTQFAVYRRESWEASTKGMSKEDKEEAFWVYLKERGKTYDDDLKAWRRARESEKRD